MIRKILLTLFLFSYACVSASTIEVEKGKTTKYVPKNLGRALEIIGTKIEEEMIPIEIFRDGKLRVRIEKIKQRLTPKGKKTVISNIQLIYLYANGREVMRIDNTDFRPSSLSSPWPIWIEHRGGGSQNKKMIYYNLVIPEIGFYEYLEFRDGELKPLLEGEEYSGMKDAHWDLAVEILSDDPPKRSR